MGPNRAKNVLAMAREGMGVSLHDVIFYRA